MSWGRRVAVDASDGLAIAGFAALEYGMWQWSPPAAWVLGGIVLMAVAIRPYLRKGIR